MNRLDEWLMTKRLQFQFKSKLENIYPVENSILEQARKLKFDGEACFNLRLAMDEAFINAIIHGNKNKEDKNIVVIVDFDGNRAVVSVRDEGDGFDQTKLADPTEERNLYNTHGRGVFLIRQFTSEVWFNDKGNEITFAVLRSQPEIMIQSS